MLADGSRIFAHQIGLDFFDGFSAGQGAAFGDGLAEADNARIGVDLQKQPSRFYQNGLELGDLEIVFIGDRSVAVRCS